MLLEQVLIGIQVSSQLFYYKNHKDTPFMAMPLEESMTIIDSLLNIEVMIVYFDEQNEVKTYFTKNFKNLILD